jgi:hypothetical protein
LALVALAFVMVVPLASMVVAVMVVVGAVITPVK